MSKKTQKRRIPQKPSLNKDENIPFIEKEPSFFLFNIVQTNFEKIAGIKDAVTIAKQVKK